MPVLNFAKTKKSNKKTTAAQYEYFIIRGDAGEIIEYTMPDAMHKFRKMDDGKLYGVDFDGVEHYIAAV